MARTLIDTNVINRHDGWIDKWRVGLLVEDEVLVGRVNSSKSALKTINELISQGKPNG